MVIIGRICMCNNEKLFADHLFLLFLNFYVAALLQVSVSVGKVYFSPQRTEPFFSLIFKWKKCFLLAEVSHGERRRREKRESSAGFQSRSVLSCSCRPNLCLKRNSYSKPVLFNAECACPV